MAEIRDIHDKIKDIIGVGWKYPFLFSGVKGGVSVSGFENEDDSVERISQSLFQIIGTKIGERVARRSFGSRLHDLVFAPMDGTFDAEIRYFVEQSVLSYERRIILGSTTISKYPEDGRVDIEIRFIVIKTQQEGNFVYPFYTQSTIA